MSDPTAKPAYAYRAFISYSHADKVWGDWLHKALETYRVPSRLVGEETPAGVIPRRLNPIFRDREELASAHDLGNKVNEALGQSEALIVICSMHSAQSRWVNEEVSAFKRLGRAERVFCLIVDGEPDATDKPGREAEECFCPALRYQLDSNGQPTHERAEPIAADARPGKDGKANAKLKLIAGLLDVGFDQLKQREQHRKMQRLVALTSLALAVMAVTIVLAVFALISRHDAVIAQQKAVVAQQAAQRRQKQAEGLVGFMLGDLNDKLQQVNRLDIMQAVDDKAMAYFQSLPTTDVNDTALAQRAKALEKIATVRLNLGNAPGALQAYQASAKLSSKLAAKAPTDLERQIAYSRTLAFVGMVHWNQGKLEAAQQDFEAARQALRDSQLHARSDPSLLLQLTYLSTDIGHVLEARGQPDAAEAEYRNMLALTHRLIALERGNIDYETELGSAHNNLGKLALLRGDLAAAISEYRDDDTIEARLSAQDPRNSEQRGRMLRVRAILGRTLALIGDSQTGMRDLQQAVDMAAEQSKDDPHNASSKELLALYSTQLARLKRITGNLPAARTLSTQAVTIFTALAKDDPDNDDWKTEYAEALTEQAAELYAAANVNAARRSVQSALDILEPVLAKHPGDRSAMLPVVTAKLLLASLTNDPTSTQALRIQALQTLQAVKADRDDPRLLALRTEALLGLGKKDEAVAVIARLHASGYRDPDFVSILRRAHIKYQPESSAPQG